MSFKFVILIWEHRKGLFIAHLVKWGSEEESIFEVLCLKTQFLSQRFRVRMLI